MNILAAGLLLAAGNTTAVSPSPSPSPSAAPVPASVAPATLRETVNAMNPGEVQKALDALSSNFLVPESINDEAKQRALLEGLVRRLSPGVSITGPGPVAAKAVYPYLAEILDGRIGYVRPGLFDDATLEQMDAALRSFSEKKLAAVILDLRAIPSGSEFDAAANFARRFCPRGKILFSVQKPAAKQERILSCDQDPLFDGIVVLLTDADTSGAAEVLAATLRVNAGALIVGADTSGEAVEFADVPLAGGRSLRVAVSQAVLPDGKPIFPGGVKPDVAISLPQGTLEEIFTQTRENGVSRFVFDVERVRLNEAALVANTNPEIDPAPRAERSKPPLTDTVLQRAVDLVTAVEFFKKRN